MDFQHILSVLPDVLTACLAVLGGLKVLARYTPTEADDRILDAIEKPFQYVLDFFRRK
jgi:hypothetical protein